MNHDQFHLCGHQGEDKHILSIEGNPPLRPAILSLQKKEESDRKEYIRTSIRGGNGLQDPTIISHLEKMDKRSE